MKEVKFLVVESSENRLSSILENLKTPYFIVSAICTTHSRFEAILSACRENFDILFVDVASIGEQETKKLHSQIRLYPQTRAINIIFITSEDEEIFMARLRQMSNN